MKDVKFQSLISSFIHSFIHSLVITFIFLGTTINLQSDITYFPDFLNGKILGSLGDGFGVYSCQLLKISGNAKIAGEDQAYLIDAGSGGNVILLGNAKVVGDVVYGIGANLIQRGNAQIIGTPYEWNRNECPWWDYQSLEQNVIDNYQVTDWGRKKRFSGNGRVFLDDGVYVVDKLMVGGNVKVSGDKVVIFADEVKVSGNAKFILSNGYIFSEKVILSGNSRIKAIIFVSDLVKVSGNSIVYGKVSSGGRAFISGNAKVLWSGFTRCNFGGCEVPVSFSDEGTKAVTILASPLSIFIPVTFSEERIDYVESVLDEVGYERCNNFNVYDQLNGKGFLNMSFCRKENSVITQNPVGVFRIINSLGIGINGYGIAHGNSVVPNSYVSVKIFFYPYENTAIDEDVLGRIQAIASKFDSEVKYYSLMKYGKVTPREIGGNVLFHPLPFYVSLAREIKSLPEIRMVEFEIDGKKELNELWFNDDYLDYQWYLKGEFEYAPGKYGYGISVIPGWQYLYDGGGNTYHELNDVIVAVVDSGVDYRHPDLAGKLLPGCSVFGNYDPRSACPDNTGPDIEGLITCGCPEPYSNIYDEYYAWKNDPRGGHGTAVASEIAALGGFGLLFHYGIAGIGKGFNVKIVPIQIFEYSYLRDEMISASQELIAKGLRWLATMYNIKVINNSWGTPCGGIYSTCGWISSNLIESVNSLVEKGVLISWAAGNSWHVERNGDVISLIACSNLSPNQDSVSVEPRLLGSEDGIVVVSAIRSSLKGIDGTNVVRCSDLKRYPFFRSLYFTEEWCDKYDEFEWFYTSAGPEIEISAPSGGFTGDPLTGDMCPEYWGSVTKPGFLVDDVIDSRVPSNLVFRGFNPIYVESELYSGWVTWCDFDPYDDGGLFPLFNGTSAAAPLVAGVGAGLYSLVTGIKADVAEHILKDTADQIPGTGNYCIGSGRVNAERAWRSVFENNDEIDPGEDVEYQTDIPSSIHVGCSLYPWIQWAPQTWSQIYSFEVTKPLADTDAPQRPGYLVARVISKPRDWGVAFNKEYANPLWNVEFRNGGFSGTFIVAAGKSRSTRIKIWHKYNQKSSGYIKFGIWTNNSGAIPNLDVPPEEMFSVHVVSERWYFNYFPIICGIPCLIGGPVLCPWCWQCKDPEPPEYDSCSLCEEDMNNGILDSENCDQCIAQLEALPEWNDMSEECQLCVEDYQQAGWEYAMGTSECTVCFQQLEEAHNNEENNGN